MRAKPTKKYSSKINKRGRRVKGFYAKKVRHKQKFPNKLARKSWRRAWANGAYTCAIRAYLRYKGQLKLAKKEMKNAKEVE